jgi:acetyl esterase/lipase
VDLLKLTYLKLEINYNSKQTYNPTLKPNQMHTKKTLSLLLLLLISYSFSYSQEEVVYKKIDTTSLVMEVYYPEVLDASTKSSAIVFYFGGGWHTGSVDKFKKHAEYFSKRGLVCFLVDYRVKERQQTTPFESLKDAKSAIRYIREHAAAFHIDPEKIIASGGSAGGHLAAATALIAGYNEESDNLSISCKPNALVLYNPVIDNGPGGYGYDRIGEAYKNFSPLHNIKEGAPPTILFLGTNDKKIPVETVKYYQTVMHKVKSRCELRLTEGGVHGYFNYQNFENYKKTITESDEFLQSLGYLKETPQVEIK